MERFRLQRGFSSHTVTILTTSSEHAPAGSGKASARLPQQTAVLRLNYQRLPELDVLRCVAVLLVFGAHPAFKWPADTLPVLPARLWFQIGWSGVDLFFILSGFLVAGLLFADYRKHGTIHLGSFVARRGLRIWPAYYLYIGYLAILVVKFGGPWSDLLPFVLHVQNYTPITTEKYAPHLWSLALEEHFYLLLPLLLAFTRRHWSLRGFAAGVAGVLVLCALLRVSFLRPGALPFETHFRLDGLSVGVFIAYLYHFHGELFWRIARPGWLLVATGAALVAFAALPAALPRMAPTGVVNAIQLPMVYAGYGAMLLGALSLGRGDRGARAFDSGPMRLLSGIGRYSYSIYLWHLEFGFRFTGALIASRLIPIEVLWLNWLVHAVIYVVMACAGGVLASRCIETPVLALRERWFPSPARAI